MLMRSLSLACMTWLFAETQQEMRLLASDWLATPALDTSTSSDTDNDRNASSSDNFFGGFFAQSKRRRSSNVPMSIK